MKKIFEKVIIILMLVLLLTINFGTNFLKGKDEEIGRDYTFATYQNDSEYLVFSKIFQDKYYEEISEYGLVLTYDEYGNRVSNIWDKIANYNSEKEKLKIAAYRPQFGLQGHGFSFLYNKLHMPFWSLKLICCILLACIIVVICYCIYKKYNKLMATIFYITFLLSPWIVAFARNLYWVEFTWFLPAMFGILLSLDYSKAKIYIPCIFGAILIKCLCGYEYITTIMLMTISFFIIDLFVAKEKDEKIKILKTILIAGTVCLLAFVVALCIHANIRGNGNILEGLKDTYEQDVLRRTIITSNEIQYSGITKESIDASAFETVKKYCFWYTNIILGVNGEYFRLIFVATVSILIYNMLKENKDYSRDITMFFVFLATTLSWLILGKAHSYIHTSMNYVLWYFGFIQICFYIIIKFICEKIRYIDKII